jgi:hypothetical protein
MTEPKDSIMVNKERLMELAERCEAATGPDTFLDLDISQTTGAWKKWPTFKEFSPTASLDAALTLVPEGCEWRVRWCELPNGTWASIARIGENGCGLNTTAATPALALCAAALRSLSTPSMKDEDDDD